ncbi:12886_t:CDS:1, partial [Cetraspora pellucida]
MKRCWDNDPRKRPSASKICKILANWKNCMAKFYESEPVNYNESDEDESEIRDYEIATYDSEPDDILDYEISSSNTD